MKRFYRSACLPAAMQGNSALKSPDWSLTSGQAGHAFEKQVQKIVGGQFLLFLPEGCNKGSNGGKKWPLIIFLHGSDESGRDLKRLKTHGLPKIVEQRNDFPFIVASPQALTPAEGFNGDMLNGMLDDLVASLPVDVDRIYLTGLSMGGFATWGWAVETPERFAAIAPICGGWDPADAQKLKKLPIWAFHGADDDVIDITDGQDMVDAVKAVGGNVKFTVYPDGGHDVWTETYENPALYDWFMQHTKR
jgi:predicted peptidase